MQPVTIPLFGVSAALLAVLAGAPAARPHSAPPALNRSPASTAIDLAATTDPPVSVRLLLDRERYVPGSTGQVRVAIGRDGYLLVLYSDPTGHVRVAFPLDPGDPAAVSKDTVIEIRSRGDRDAFIVDDSTGVGTWYAAISSQPFQFDSIQVSHHWDYRTIPRVRSPESAEAELTTFVERIQPARFEYDIVSYSIGVDSIARSAGSADAGPEGPEFMPRGPFWPGPWTASGPWAPGPWWSEPHWPGPYYDHVVEGSGGGGGAGGAMSTADARIGGASRPKSPGTGGGGPSGDHGGRGRY